MLTNDTSRITKKRGSAKYRRQFTAVWLESPTILTVSTSSWILEHDSIGTDIDSFLGSHNSKLGAGYDQFVSQVEIQQQTNLVHSPRHTNQIGDYRPPPSSRFTKTGLNGMQNTWGDTIGNTQDVYQYSWSGGVSLLNYWAILFPFYSYWVSNDRITIFGFMPAMLLIY